MRKSLIFVLSVANLLMLVIGIITIPPNLQAEAEKGPHVPRAEQTESVTQSPDGENPSATTENDSISTPKETGESLSTEERPDLEDFLWYTEDVIYYGIPSGVNNIESVGQLNGGWKALIIYDPNNENDAGAMEFLNVSLSGTAERLNLTLDWYQIFWANEGENIDETDMEDSIFSGKWESGGLWASGAGTIRLTQFYELNRKQFAVGTMDTPDGTPALVALVRP